MCNRTRYNIKLCHRIWHFTVPSQTLHCTHICYWYTAYAITLSQYWVVSGKTYVRNRWAAHKPLSLVLQTPSFTVTYTAPAPSSNFAAFLTQNIYVRCIIYNLMHVSNSIIFRIHYHNIPHNNNNRKCLEVGKFSICSEKNCESVSYRCMYNTPPKPHVSLHGPDSLSNYLLI